MDKSSIMKQIDDIKDDMINISYYATKVATKKIEEDFKSIRGQILSDFYKYKISNHRSRKNDLYDAVLLGKSKTRLNKGSASIEINDKMMATPKDSYITSEYIFDLIWNQGIRGLPEKGKVPLDESYNWYGNQFNEGELWVNPYWNPSKYHNIFNTKVRVKNFRSTVATPNDVVEQYVDYWGKLRGIDIFDETFDEIRKNFK